MSEQEAVERTLTGWLKDQINYLNHSEIAAISDMVYIAQLELGIPDDNDAELTQFRALEDLLTSGKWKVVYSEETP